MPWWSWPKEAQSRRPCPTGAGTLDIHKPRNLPRSATCVPLVIIGGFGSPASYFECVRRTLKQNHQPVIIIPLLHLSDDVANLTLEAQMNRVLSILTSRLGKGPLCIHIAGFSTGALVCAHLANTHPDIVRKILLINPASCFFRLNEKSLATFCPDNAKYPHAQLLGHVHFADTDTLSMIADYESAAQWIFWATNRQKYLRRVLAWAYYHAYGKSVFEPLSQMELIFRTPLVNLKALVSECIIKPNIWKIMCDLQTKGIHVDIMVGKDDFYMPFSLLIGEAFPKNVRVHRVRGEHHILFNDPSLAAAKIMAIVSNTILLKCPYI